MNAQTKIEPSLVSALAKALPELESAKKNKANPAFKSKYADLAAVIEAIGPIREHGLWYRQHVHESADGVMIETLYIHDSGEQLSAGTLFMPAVKRDAQGFGSALSYARRYSLQTAFGLATEDDDGSAAAGGYSQRERRDEPPAANGSTLRDKLEQSIEQESAPRNWGGRYPTKTALKAAMHTHHAELERIGVQGTMDDLDGYLSSPEYQDYIKQASIHAPAYLEGPLPETAPPEFIQTFALEQKARDMIAIRGNVAADVEG